MNTPSPSPDKSRGIHTAPASPNPTPPKHTLMGKNALGYLTGLGFIAIWSGFIVFARFGVKGNLTPYDITALRFAIGSIITLPFAYLYWPPHLSLAKILTLAALGPGIIYSVLMYVGLDYSPAAFAGVFANGTMPIFTAFFAWLIVKEKLPQSAYLAIFVILSGSILVGYESIRAAGMANLTGVPFFMAASFVLAAYMVLLRLWKLTAKQTLAIINLPNAIVFLPLWYLFLPSGIHQATNNEILLQLLFQGLGPSFLALIFFTYTIQTLGTTAAAGFAAVVPATAALLAIPVLGETLNLIEWLGVITVSVGLLLLILKRKP